LVLRHLFSCFHQLHVPCSYRRGGLATEGGGRHLAET
jgi:hypothetical protein